MSNRLEKLVTKMQEMQNVMKKEGEAIFKEAVQELFNTYPKLTGVRVRGYTVYFNDGDACEYGIHDVSYKLADTAEDEGDYEDGWLESSYYTENAKGDPEHVAVSKFGNSLYQIEDAVKLAFGDHAEILCTREGISVDDYSDHD